MSQHFVISRGTVVCWKGCDSPVIKNALEIFRRDMDTVLAQTHSNLANTINIFPSADLQPEQYIMEVTGDAIRISVGDDLGCMYALLFISERFLGVQPFWFWNDQQFTKSNERHIPAGTYRSPNYKVRFRGWFINDEVLISNWKPEPENRSNWKMAFEAILRCGGNMTIPGSDEYSHINFKMASEMGLWITHHHAEPLGAEMFLRKYPDLSPSYLQHADLFIKLWEQAILEQKDSGVIWCLGFRGQGDRPFWEDDPASDTPEKRGKLMSDVIRLQYELVCKHVHNPVFCTNLYGEVMELYKQDCLELPAGVIKIWADNGFGKMVSRRQSNWNPRIPALPGVGEAGPHGIYYHCSFHDLQASNHLTMSPNSPEFLASELTEALKAGACDYWIINSGSIKPHTYTLDLVGHMWKSGVVDIEVHSAGYTLAYYPHSAAVVADCIREYFDCTVKYGSNADDHAGEQLYHHPIREAICHWMQSKGDTSVNSLFWLAGNKPLSEQLQALYDMCLHALPKWKALERKCIQLLENMSGAERQLFEDSILLQVRIHHSGILGAVAFCKSYAAYLDGNHVYAFLRACQAGEYFATGTVAMERAQHGKWEGYYQGDCMTNIRLTDDCITGLIHYLRITGDCTDFHRWEYQYIIPKRDRQVVVLIWKKLHLSNQELYRQLKQILQIKSIDE